MARKFLVPIDLTKNELQNAAIQNLSSVPGTPATGQIYFDTTTVKFQGYSGAAWLDLSHTAAEILAKLLTVDGAGSGLDADLLDAQSGAFYLARANHTGTQLASTVSDFDTQVRTSRLDQMAAPTASVSLNSQKITNLATPTSGNDATNKTYVDGLAGGGVAWKAPVRVATTVAGTLATSFENGDTIDGVVLATGDRILIKDQAAGAENGIYVVAATGAPTRATDSDTATEILQAAVWVSEGTTNADQAFVNTTNAPITLDTTALVFVQFSGLGQITAGAGMTKTGNTIDVVGTTSRISVSANAIDIASDYAGQTSIITLGTITTGTWDGTDIAVTAGGTGANTAAGARTNLNVPGIYSATIGDGAATSITITQATHGLAANGTNTVHLYDATTGAEVFPDITVAPGTGNVTLAFSVAPTINQYRVVING